MESRISTRLTAAQREDFSRLCAAAGLDKSEGLRFAVTELIRRFNGRTERLTVSYVRKNPKLITT